MKTSSFTWSESLVTFLHFQKQPVPADFARNDPPNNYIYRFIKNLFVSAQVSYVWLQNHLYFYSIYCFYFSAKVSGVFTNFVIVGSGDNSG